MSWDIKNFSMWTSWTQGVNNWKSRGRLLNAYVGFIYVLCSGGNFCEYFLGWRIAPNKKYLCSRAHTCWTMHYVSKIMVHKLSKRYEYRWHSFVISQVCKSYIKHECVSSRSVKGGWPRGVSKPSSSKYFTANIKIFVLTSNI